MTTGFFFCPVSLLFGRSRTWIGYDGEAEPTATEAQGKSEWRGRVERSIDFDPWMEHRGTMALDLTAENPSWEITSAEEQMREAQGKHRSLREKYGKK